MSYPRIVPDTATSSENDNDKREREELERILEDKELLANLVVCFEAVKNIGFPSGRFFSARDCARLANEFLPGFIDEELIPSFGEGRLRQDEVFARYGVAKPKSPKKRVDSPEAASIGDARRNEAAKMKLFFSALEQACTEDETFDQKRFVEEENKRLQLIEQAKEERLRQSHFRVPTRRESLKRRLFKQRIRQQEQQERQAAEDEAKRKREAFERRRSAFLEEAKRAFENGGGRLIIEAWENGVPIDDLVA